MRLINVDALIQKCGDWYIEEGPEDGFIGTVKSLVESQPTIQLPQCKDCFWWGRITTYKDGKQEIDCKCGRSNTPDGYCHKSVPRKRGDLE